MAPTFIAKSLALIGTGLTNNQTYMGGILAGDLLFILAASNQLAGGSIGGIATPSGWTFVGGGGFRDGTPQDVGVGHLFYKIATGSESGSVPVTRTGSTGTGNPFYTQMYQFRDAKLIESTFVFATGNGNTTVTYGALTVAGNARTLIAFCVQAGSAPATPAGYTNKASDTAAGGGVVTTLRCEDKEDVGTDGLVTTTGGVFEGWITIHLSIFTPAGRSFIVN